MLSTDPVGFRVDDDGDLDISGGRVHFVSGLEGAVQGADARCETMRGDLFWDPTKGLPIVENDFVSEEEALLGPVYDPARVERAYRAQILDTPGIVEVTSFIVNYDPAEHAANPVWVARCKFDDVDSEVSSGG